MQKATGKPTLLPFCRSRDYLQNDKEKLAVARHDLLHSEETKPLKNMKNSFKQCVCYTNKEINKKNGFILWFEVRSSTM